MKISIIITSYNYGLFIERCIRSCFEQKYIEPNSHEVIVVDDHSHDHTLEIIKKFRVYPNLRIIANPKNVGVAEASNIGIRAALGRYFVRVDADDYISENMLFFMSALLSANKDALGVACDYYLMTENEKVIERRSAQASPISCGIMYRRDLFVQAGLYNPEFRHREEEELRRRMGEYYKLYYLQMPLYRYRMHENNKTKQPEYKHYAAKLNRLHGDSELSNKKG
ncbi:MAG: glycosyltransferase [Anaerolineae bacterium]|nr:glycosyltransferase [Anaerolineae bacterium]